MPHVLKNAHPGFSIHSFIRSFIHSGSTEWASARYWSVWNTSIFFFPFLANLLFLVLSLLYHFVCLFLYFVSCLAMFSGPTNTVSVKTELGLINSRVFALEMTSLSSELVTLSSWQPMWWHNQTRVPMTHTHTLLFIYLKICV